jgi:hypothetical protein
MNLARMIAAKFYSDDRSGHTATATVDPLSLRLWSKLVLNCNNTFSY